MRAHALFEDVRERLLRAGIAPRHVRRYVRELKDHVEDSTAAEILLGTGVFEARARALVMIGDATMLTEAMIGRRKFRAIAVRAPWSVFLTIPPLAILGFYLCTTITLGYAAWIGIPGFYFDTGAEPLEAPDWYWRLGLAATWTANFILPPLVSGLIVLIAWRQRMGPHWPAIGILLTAILGAWLTADADFPASPAGQDWTIALIVISDFREILLRTLLTLLPLGLLLVLRRIPAISGSPPASI